MLAFMVGLPIFLFAAVLFTALGFAVIYALEDPYMRSLMLRDLRGGEDRVQLLLVCLGMGLLSTIGVFGLGAIIYGFGAMMLSVLA